MLPKNKGLEIYAYCIMTSHVHLIIGTHGNNMEDTLRDLKSYTSKKMKHAIEEHPQESRREWMLWMMKRAGNKNGNNKDYQFWQQNNHPIELNTNEMIDKRLDYLHNNPVEAGFVTNPEDYVYSSAQDYAEERGLIEIDLIQ
ncbi:MAG: transposase [Bacteroidetes bacterium]|nr:MAG: transposase [Bacteroidota bacterium]